MEPANQVQLEGVILPRMEERTTPAGLPVTRFQLEHRSKRSIAGLDRVVRCRITVTALGEDLVERARTFCVGDCCRVEGVLVQRVRKGHDQDPSFGRIELHATVLCLSATE